MAHSTLVALDRQRDFLRHRRLRTGGFVHRRRLGAPRPFIWNAAGPKPRTMKWPLP